MQHRRLEIIPWTAIGLTLALAPFAPAATLTVTNSGDSGPGTLRAAIIAAAPGDQIVFDPALAGIHITLASPLPKLDRIMGIDGGAAPGVTISGADQYRIFFADANTIDIRNLTLAHGHAQGGKGGDGGSGLDDGGPGGGGAGLGGALFVNSGTVSVTGVAFANSTAVGGQGGGPGAAGGGGGGGVDGNDGQSASGVGGAGGNGGPFGGTGGAGASGDCFSNGYPATDGGDGAGGGGGAYCGLIDRDGGNGGFGGGGGGQGILNDITPFPVAGNGGFGGGGGTYSAGTGGAGGAFGGHGGLSDFSICGAGGGGAGLGGAIFVRSGAVAHIADSVFTGNTATGGEGGPTCPLGIGSFSGDGKGGAVFVMDGATVTQCNPFYAGNTASTAGNTAADNADSWGTLSGCAPPPPLPVPVDVWAINPGSWPVSSMTIGTRTYADQDLLAALVAPIRGNGALILAQQLIAAKLNAGQGTTIPVPVAAAIEAADQLLSPLGLGTSSTKETKHAFIAVANALETFNESISATIP